MIEYTYKAILLSSKDYKESDKLIRLLSVEGGIITALMKGVKKQTAKLRFGAMPFAFCEYTLYKTGGIFIVTACNQIEDLFSISNNYDDFTAGSIMLEAADYATGMSVNYEIFILLLNSLKLILYKDINPYLVAIKFVQNVIHLSGYSYEYKTPPDEITSVMDLLSLLNVNDLNNKPDERLNSLPSSLIHKTLIKLVANFEKKFEEEIKSKKLLVN